MTYEQRLEGERKPKGRLRKSLPVTRRAGAKALQQDRHRGQGSF